MSTKTAAPKAQLQARQDFHAIRNQYLENVTIPVLWGQLSPFAVGEGGDKDAPVKKFVNIRIGAIAASQFFQYFQKFEFSPLRSNDDELTARAIYLAYLNQCVLINTPPAYNLDFFTDLISESQYTPDLMNEVARFQRTWAVSDNVDHNWRSVEKTLNVYERTHAGDADGEFIITTREAIANYRNLLGMWKGRSRNRLDIK